MFSRLPFGQILSKVINCFLLDKYRPQEVIHIVVGWKNFSSFGFAEGSAFSVGAKPNVLKCAVGLSVFKHCLVLKKVDTY
jgi:hypothetical protein